MNKVKVLFNGVCDRRVGREGQLMISVFRGYDPHLKINFTAFKDKVIEFELSKKHVAELNADYPGAFTIMDETPVKKKAGGRPKGSKNKRRRKKKAKPRKTKKQPSSLLTESATS